MTYKTLALASVASVMLATAAFAMDLPQARSSGAVGEKLDGYVQALQNSPQVNALVAEVNARRQQEYARISQQNGQPVNVVAKLAASQIIGKLPAGSSYQAADGSWKKR